MVTILMAGWNDTDARSKMFALYVAPATLRYKMVALYICGSRVTVCCETHTLDTHSHFADFTDTQYCTRDYMATIAHCTICRNTNRYLMYSYSFSDSTTLLHCTLAKPEKRLRIGTALRAVYCAIFCTLGKGATKSAVFFAVARNGL